MTERREEELEHVHRVRYTRMERLAGLFVIIAAVLLIAALVFSRQIAFLLADTFTLRANAQTVENVSTESAVRIAGMEVGRVTGIEWTKDNEIRLTMKIRSRFHDLVREDSVARLNSLALLGEPAVEISRGDPAANRVADGAQIPVEITPTLDELVSRLAPAVDNIVATTERVNAIVHAIRPAETARLTRELTQAVESARSLLAGVNRSEGLAGRLFHDEQLADRLEKTVNDVNGALVLTQARLRDIEPLIAAGTARAQEMDRLMENVNGLVTRLSDTVDSFGDGQGKNVEALLFEARNALDEAERTLQAIRNTWPISGNAPEDGKVEPLPPQPPNR